MFDFFYIKNKIDWLTENLKKLFFENFFKKTKVLIVDDIFPCDASPFRYTEYMHYLKAFPDCIVVSDMSAVSMLSDRRAEMVLKDFKTKYPEYVGKIIKSKSIKFISANIVYVTFYNNLVKYGLGTKIKKNFIVNLYPGGGLRFGNETIDRKLRLSLGSKYCQKVITSQSVIRDYLVKKKICEASKIIVLFGVVIPKCCYEKPVGKKKFFGDQKETLDICFCAHKYMPKGIDKGFDIFVQVAKRLHVIDKKINFHVVGEFGNNDIDVLELGSSIHFYGRRESAWFDDFYLDKDIIISPNRPGILTPGAFDGFPTGSVIEAGIRQVAMFVTDELGMNANSYFSNLHDIVIIKLDVDDIISKIMHYKCNPDKLKELGQKGRDRILELYSYENQVVSRENIIRSAIQSHIP